MTVFMDPPGETGTPRELKASTFTATVTRTFAPDNIHVAGELDISVGPALRAALRTGPAVVGLVTIDLRDVTFVDAASLRELADFADSVLDRGGAVRTLVAPDGPVERVAVLLGWADRLRCDSTFDGSV